MMSFEAAQNGIKILHLNFFVIWKLRVKGRMILTLLFQDKIFNNEKPKRKLESKKESMQTKAQRPENNPDFYGSENLRNYRFT